jgi:phosphotransferase system enzyme I (PtsI)
VDLFKTQLRAALRAGVHGNLRIMFPMVTKASEVAQARAIIAECCQEMDAAGIAYAKKVDIGIMIEIPAAAILSEHLAQEVDFFSIGTNDLSQYTMAVDRTNTTLANLANAFDPSVLTLISMVVQAAHKYGKDVGVCGELAGDPLAVPILLGLGLDELSMNTPVVPVVKQIVRSLSYAESQALAQEVLKMETPADVKKYVIEKLPFLQDIG